MVILFLQRNHINTLIFCNDVFFIGEHLNVTKQGEMLMLMECIVTVVIHLNDHSMVITVLNDQIMETICQNILHS